MHFYSNRETHGTW